MFTVVTPKKFAPSQQVITGKNFIGIKIITSRKQYPKNVTFRPMNIKKALKTIALVVASTISLVIVLGFLMLVSFLPSPKKIVETVSSVSPKNSSLIKKSINSNKGNTSNVDNSTVANDSSAASVEHMPVDNTEAKSKETDQSETPRRKRRGFTGSGRTYSFFRLVTVFGNSSPCAGASPFSA